MARQRVTIAKLGGMTADVTARRLRGFAADRTTNVIDEWSSEQWPPRTRIRIDAFADQLRLNGYEPPVVHFVEWSDLWSMGDVFRRYLTPANGEGPIELHGGRFEVFAYALPDGGRLARTLAKAGPFQFEEYGHYAGRLRETIAAWDGMIDRSVLVVLREVFGGLVTDEELLASMSIVPEWLADQPGLEETLI